MRPLPVPCVLDHPFRTIQKGSFIRMRHMRDRAPKACKLGGCYRLAALALFRVRWQTSFDCPCAMALRVLRSEMSSQTVQPSASASDPCSAFSLSFPGVHNQCRLLWKPKSLVVSYSKTIRHSPNSILIFCGPCIKCHQDPSERASGYHHDAAAAACVRPSAPSHLKAGL